MEWNLTLGYVLIAVGFLLLVAELFIPSGGILLVLALAGLAVGVALTFQYSVQFGLVTMIAVFVALPIFGGMLLHYWTRTPIGKRLVVKAPEDDASVHPAQKDLEPLRGRVGKALSALRPAGVVDFDGRRVDALTEGMMVEAGQLVRCLDVRAGKVIVRPVETPPARAELENADFS
jgi:membrane-bound serine protease (ClpP class)